MTPLERARVALKHADTVLPQDPRDKEAGFPPPYPTTVDKLYLRTALAEADRLAAENERLRGLLVDAGVYVKLHAERATMTDAPNLDRDLATVFGRMNRADFDVVLAAMARDREAARAAGFRDGITASADYLSDPQRLISNDGMRLAANGIRKLQPPVKA